MSEIILATAARDLAIVDGMARAMMVTRQTASATVVMFPMGKTVFEHKVACGTNLRTPATMHTGIGIDCKLAVAYHPMVEITANDMAHQPRGPAAHRVPFATLLHHNHLAILLQGIARQADLLLLALRLVCIHKRQAHV